MRNFVFSVMLLSSLLNQGVDATQVDVEKDAPKLNEISQTPNPLKYLEDLEAHNSEQAWALCQDILDSSFFHTRQAKAMGTIKSRKVSSYCQQLKLKREKPQVGSLKENLPRPASQPQQEKKKVGSIAAEKKAAFSKPDPEPFHKKPPAMKTGAKGFAAQQEQLQSNKHELASYVQEMQKAEDVHVQEQAREFERRLEEVNKQILEARSYYDNLLAQIVALREDFDQFSALKTFNKQHLHDTPEDFLEAFEQFQKAKKHDILGLEQVQFAHEELKKARMAQQNGEHELAAIIKQMDAIHSGKN